MIRSITGQLTSKRGGTVIITVGGVGFQVTVPLNEMTLLPAVGQVTSLHTHLHVREDALDLYGFLTPIDLMLFESLISVSGIGPKSAVNIMGISSTDQIIAAINEGKTELLVKASGVGKKTAERVVLELRGKVEAVNTGATTAQMESDVDLEETLVSLGFTKAEAKAAIKTIDNGVTGFNNRLKAALKKKS